MHTWNRFWYLIVLLGIACVIGSCSKLQSGGEEAENSDTEMTNVVKRMYETLVAGDMEGAFATMADDIRWVYYGGEDVIPFSGVYVGHKGVAQFFADYGAVAEPLGMDLQSFHVSGDTVFVTGVENSRVLATRKTYAAPWVHVFKLVDGKIVSYEEYIDSALVASAFE